MVLSALQQVSSRAGGHGSSLHMTFRRLQRCQMHACPAQRKRKRPPPDPPLPTRAPPVAAAHRNSAFSAPRIWMVEAGALARLTREPTCAMSRAPTSSPTSTVRLGATAIMRDLR